MIIRGLRIVTGDVDLEHPPFSLKPAYSRGSGRQRWAWLPSPWSRCLFLLCMYSRKEQNRLV